ncbi:hypothetical protein DFH06DRAFT_1144923 [Mycena polygramma]|nr:hypothetical protein DFH06DRAFT_1144923 [Mycena polygramma]
MSQTTGILRIPLLGRALRPREGYGGYELCFDPERAVYVQSIAAEGGVRVGNLGEGGVQVVFCSRENRVWAEHCGRERGTGWQPGEGGGTSCVLLPREPGMGRALWPREGYGRVASTATDRELRLLFHSQKSRIERQGCCSFANDPENPLYMVIRIVTGGADRGGKKKGMVGPGPDPSRMGYLLTMLGDIYPGQMRAVRRRAWQDGVQRGLSDGGGWEAIDGVIGGKSSGNGHTGAVQFVRRGGPGAEGDEEAGTAASEGGAEDEDEDEKAGKTQDRDAPPGKKHTPNTVLLSLFTPRPLPLVQQGPCGLLLRHPIYVRKGGGAAGVPLVRQHVQEGQLVQVQVPKKRERKGGRTGRAKRTGEADKDANDADGAREMVKERTSYVCEWSARSDGVPNSDPHRRRYRTVALGGLRSGDGGGLLGT